MLSQHPATTLFPYTRTSSAGRWRTWAGSAKHPSPHEHPAPCWQGRAPAPCRLPPTHRTAHPANFPTSRQADKLASRQTPPPSSSPPAPRPRSPHPFLLPPGKPNAAKTSHPVSTAPRQLSDFPTSWQVGKLASWQASAVQRGGAPARNVNPPPHPPCVLAA